MSDYLDPYGFPLDSVTALLSGDHKERSAPIKLADEVYSPPTFPILSCALCGDWAGTAICHAGDDVEAIVAELNKDSLCPSHWSDWNRAGGPMADWIEQNSVFWKGVK